MPKYTKLLPPQDYDKLTLEEKAKYIVDMAELLKRQTEATAPAKSDLPNEQSPAPAEPSSPNDQPPAPAEPSSPSEQSAPRIEPDEPKTP